MAQVQELSYSWSVNLKPLWGPAHLWLNGDFLPNSPDLVTFAWVGEETGQLSDPLHKERTPWWESAP